MNPFVYMFVIKPPSELALRLAMILLIAAALEALAGLLLIRRKTAAKTVLAALSFLSAAAALALLLITPDAGALDPMPRPELKPQGDPHDAAAAFFDALQARDTETAEGLLDGEGRLLIGEATESEGAQRMLQALAGAYAVRLRGGSVVDGLDARQSASLTVLDLNAVQAALNGETEAGLRELCEQRPRRFLADEAGAFLPEAAEEAWTAALSRILEYPEEYTRTSELELQLHYTPLGWRISNAEELLCILNGGVLDDDVTEWAARSLKEASGELVYDRPVYTVAEDAPAGPAFDASNYVYTNDPAVVQQIVDSAAVLLDGQELCWNPSIQRLDGSKMICYCDDTILMICWKEIVNDCCLSFCEVKIAHGSQLRRALAGGSYSRGPGLRIRETEFAKSVNAVASINGDFYDYRNLGITVYQREVYRNNPALIDSCFFTASGDMLFSHRGELKEKGEAEQFVKDNDVVFGLAFGPILVENGEVTHTASYPVGEVQFHYSRSAIGQLDSLHYLLMTAGFDAWYDNVPDINQTAQYIQAKGVDKAYALDGGGTAEIVVDGKAFNHVDFDTERPMSDIIYFVTALPEE
ncbi:MAG: phosphodiester glycosidase family protein [Oscillospiraceae bacterium]|nr:phosphodiester glycosidase family protein [Oscillospiraceae bacterium]